MSKRKIRTTRHLPPTAEPSAGRPTPDDQPQPADDDPAADESSDTTKRPELPPDAYTADFVKACILEDLAKKHVLELMAQARADDAALSAARMAAWADSAGRQAADLRRLLDEAGAEISSEDAAKLPDPPPGDGMELLPSDDPPFDDRPPDSGSDGRRFTEKLQYQSITLHTVDDLARVFSSASPWAGYHQLMDDLHISRRTAQRLIRVIRQSSPDDCRILIDARPAEHLAPRQGLYRLRPQFLVRRSAAAIVYKTAFFPHRGNPHFHESEYQAELSTRRIFARVTAKRSAGSPD